MNHLIRTLLLSLLVLGAATACKKAPPPAPAEAPLVVPADPADSNAWKKYMAERASRYMKAEKQKTGGRLYAYFLPKDGDHAELLKTVQDTLDRGVLASTVLLFGSPDSPAAAAFIEQAFTGVREKSLNGVIVMFVGGAAEQARVQAAIAASGVEFVFLEAK